MRTSSGPKSKLSKQSRELWQCSVSNIAWPCHAFALRCFVIAVTAAGSAHTVTRFVQNVGDRCL
jgi:hypothetical protein